jgi:hypothetical protein
MSRILALVSLICLIEFSKSVCNNNCITSNDGECDDGGYTADFITCGLGNDCSDCGSRNNSAPSLYTGASDPCTSSAVATWKTNKKCVSNASCTLVDSNINSFGHPWVRYTMACTCGQGSCFNERINFHVDGKVRQGSLRHECSCEKEGDISFLTPCDWETKSGACMPLQDNLGVGYDINYYDALDGYFKDSIFNLSIMSHNTYWSGYINRELDALDKATQQFESQMCGLFNYVSGSGNACDSDTSGNSESSGGASYIVPKHIQVYPLPTSACSIDASVYSSSKEKTKGFALKVGKSYKNLEGSLGIDQEYTHSEKKESYMTHTECVITLYKIIIGSSAPLHSQFVADIAALPAVYSETEYRDFIKKYGTHFSREIVYGGKFQSDSLVKKSLVTETSVTAVEAELKLNFEEESGIAGEAQDISGVNVPYIPEEVGLAHAGTNAKFKKMLKNNICSSQLWEVRGGGSNYEESKVYSSRKSIRSSDYFQRIDEITWRNRVVDKPWPLVLNLQPIYTLVSDGDKSQNVATAMENYLATPKPQLLFAELGVPNSCAGSLSSSTKISPDNRMFILAILLAVFNAAPFKGRSLGLILCAFMLLMFAKFSTAQYCCNYWSDEPTYCCNGKCCPGGCCVDALSEEEYCPQKSAVSSSTFTCNSNDEKMFPGDEIVYNNKGCMLKNDEWGDAPMGSAKVCKQQPISGGIKSCNKRGFCTCDEWSIENNCYTDSVCNTEQNSCKCPDGKTCTQDWTNNGTKTNCRCACKFHSPTTRICNLETTSGHCVPGLAMLAAGFDITKIGDFSMVKSHIWDLKEMETSGEIQDSSNCKAYVTPKYATVEIFDEVHVKYDVVNFHSKKELSEYLDNKFTLDAGLDASLPSEVMCGSNPLSAICEHQLQKTKDSIMDAASGAIGAEIEASYTIDEALKAEKSFASSTITVGTHKITVKDSTPFHTSFKARIQSLPSTYDKIKYENFILDYGTHFATSVTLGGEIKNTAYATSCQRSISASQNVKAAMETQLGKRIGSISVEMEFRNQESSSSTSSLSRQRWSTKGGLGLAFKEPKFIFQKWVNEVRRNPWPTNFTLHNIAFLMPDQQRSINMETALEAYFKAGKEHIDESVQGKLADPECDRNSNPAGTAVVHNVCLHILVLISWYICAM